MRRYLLLSLFLLARFVCHAGLVVPDPVTDGANNDISEGNSAAKVAEQQTVNRISNELQLVNERIQKMIDHVNVVSRRVSSYVETAEEVVETAETLKRGYEVFSRISEDVPQMDFLLPSEQLRVINESIGIMEGIQLSFAKIEKISTERFAGFADMDDGERIDLLRTYLSYIRENVYLLEDLYDTLVRKGGGLSAFSRRYGTSMNAVVFGF